MGDYCTKVMLAKLGASVNIKTVSEFELAYFRICHSEFEKLKIKDLKSKGKAKG